MKTLLDNGGKYVTQNDNTLLPSLPFCSPSGFSGVTANFFPWMIVWMTSSQGKEAREDEREKMQRFLSISDRVLAHKVPFIHSYYILSSLSLSPQYPTSAKTYLHKFYNAPLAPVSRVFDAAINEQDVRIAVKLNRSINNHPS